MSHNGPQWNPFESPRTLTVAYEEQDQRQTDLEQTWTRARARDQAQDQDQELTILYDSDQTRVSARAFKTAFFAAIALTPVTIVLWIKDQACKKQRILTCFVSCLGSDSIPHSDRIRTQQVGNALVFVGKGAIQICRDPCLVLTRESEYGLTISIPLGESSQVASIFGTLEMQDKDMRVILLIDHKTVSIHDATRPSQTTWTLERICLVRHESPESKERKERKGKEVN